MLHQRARRALKKASQRKAQLCGAFYFSQHKCAIIARQIVGSLRTRSLALREQKNVRIGRIGVLAGYLPTALRQNGRSECPRRLTAQGSVPRRA
jgi:hypothetical protein